MRIATLTLLFGGFAVGCSEQSPVAPASPAGGDSAIAEARIDTSLGHGGRPLTTTMTGAAEVPGPGDPDGNGTAELTLNRGQSEVCFRLTVSGIAPASAAHIHRGAPTEAGPVVIPLAPPTTGSSEACVSAAQELIQAIIQNPENYYVNVHNAPFPGGAVRGQLSK
jgi:hypothetical protein